MNSGHRPSSPMLRGALGLAVALPAHLAGAQSIDELRRAIDALQQQMQALERRQAATDAAASAAVTQGDSKGSFRLPGSGTSVTLGGYVKLDAVFSNPSAGTGSSADLQLSPGAIPVGPQAGDDEHGQVKFGARESRLYVRTSTPTPLGELATHLEGDFYGTDGNESVSNSHGLRLRHAYGVLGPFLAGQTWTNFMYVPALPETVDFGGPAGQVFGRQAQVRWTKAWRGVGILPAGQWSVALENPESVLTLPNGTAFRADDDRLPDVTAQWVGELPRGKLSLAGLLRQVRADADVTQGARQRTGAAASIAGVVPAGGKDDMRFTLAAGNALGRYANGFFHDGVVGADARIRLPSQWLGFAAYRHFWRDDLRSSVVLSMAQQDNPADTAGTANRRTRSVHGNLVWSPVAGTDLGVEYIHADRQTEDGQAGRLDRLQASAKYAF